MTNFSEKASFIIESFQKDRGELPVQESQELVEFKSFMKDYIRYRILNEQILAADLMDMTDDQIKQIEQQRPDLLPGRNKKKTGPDFAQMQRDLESDPDVKAYEERYGKGSFAKYGQQRLPAGILDDLGQLFGDPLEGPTHFDAFKEQERIKRSGTMYAPGKGPDSAFRPVDGDEALRDAGLEALMTAGAGAAGQLVRRGIRALGTTPPPTSIRPGTSQNRRGMILGPDGKPYRPTPSPEPTKPTAVPEPTSTPTPPRTTRSLEIPPQVRAATGVAKDVIGRHGRAALDTAKGEIRQTLGQIPSPAEYAGLPKQVLDIAKMPLKKQAKIALATGLAGEVLPSQIDKMTGGGSEPIGTPAHVSALQGDYRKAFERLGKYVTPTPIGILAKLGIKAYEGGTGRDILDDMAGYIEKKTGKTPREHAAGASERAVRALPGGDEALDTKPSGGDEALDTKPSGGDEALDANPWDNIYSDFAKDFEKDFGRQPTLKDWEDYKRGAGIK